MSTANTPSLLPEHDYEAIENAVLETERGRWFLQEYARRNRHAETEVLLTTLERIEGLVRDTTSAAAPAQNVKFDVADMMTAINTAKQEIAELSDLADNTKFATASAELDAIVTSTEKATQEILGSAEKLQEIAWTLRESGLDEEVCDAIDMHTTDIYMACSFQDLTGQRTSKVVQVLNYLENRIRALLRTLDPDGALPMDNPLGPAKPDETYSNDQRPDAHLLNGPQFEGEGVSQEAVDDFFDSITDDDMLAHGGGDFDNADIDAIDFDSISFDEIEPDDAPTEDASGASAVEAEAAETVDTPAAPPTVHGTNPPPDFGDETDPVADLPDPTADLTASEKMAILG